MPERKTFFRPWAVIITDEESGIRRLEIDFENSLVQDHDFTCHPDESFKDGEWLDELILMNGMYERCGDNIISLTSLGYSLD